MGDLIVKPAYVLGPRDILTVDKLNLLGTPVVELALADPVNDQNFCRNGNFYSSFWTNAAGVTCPAGIWTPNANYWLCRPDVTAPFTSLTAAFTQPAVNTTVSITVGATAWMSPTQAIYIIGGGNYTVSSVTDSTHAVIKNLGTGGNAAPGVSVPSGNYVSPSAAAVTCLRSSVVPDQFSLFSAEIQGAGSVAAVEFGQQINGDLSATLRRKCTFSGYIYNGTGLTLSPTLNFYTCNAFNNFSNVTLQTTVNLQTGANATWTYATATIDLSSGTFANVANGLLIAIVLPAGSLNDPAKYVLFSRLKFQIGEVATQFVDDTSLFVTSPSVDSTMLQDGCIARPSLFLPNVVPKGAYQAKSIENGDIDDGAIDGRTLKAGAAIANLGFTPINKAGDNGIGTLTHTIDTVGGPNAFNTGALYVLTTTGAAANDGYMPAIGFARPAVCGRALGLSTTGRFKTVDHIGGIGYLLDTVTGVDTASIQDKAVTLQKLSDALVALLIAPGTVHQFAGPSPPAGWLICDGSAISRTTYSALFTAIGTYWGAGDSVTTFNLPDFRGRAPIGYVNSAATGITARTFGSRGGNETHTLSVGEMPTHGHGINDNTHTHSASGHTHTYINPVGGSFGVQGGSSYIYYPTGVTNTGSAADSIGSSSSNISVQNTGGSAPHDIMQPFGVLYFIIKT